MFGLTTGRAELYARIGQRYDAMLAAGWLDEVRRLRDLPRPLSREARQALGYRELLDWLNAGGDWSETVDLIRTHTRQFAKRQLTWFRHLPSLVAVPSDAPDAAERVLKAGRVNVGELRLGEATGGRVVIEELQITRLRVRETVTDREL